MSDQQDRVNVPYRVRDAIKLLEQFGLDTWISRINLDALMQDTAGHPYWDDLVFTEEDRAEPESGS
jgi:hypothetical protein